MLIPAYPEVRVLGFAAFSGSGKTTLLTRLIPLLTKTGLRIAIIKHSHHDFEIDKPGKDSYELHHAGAQQTLLTSRYRSALIKENHDQSEPVLKQALAQLDLTHIDLVLVEGFRNHTDLTKIEIHRPALGKPRLSPRHPNIIALVSDEPIDTDIPVLDIDRPQDIARFILRWIDA
jgi:molybdopterin-guanine dinucleotide biosynthesis protein MobB